MNMTENEQVNASVERQEIPSNEEGQFNLTGRSVESVVKNDDDPYLYTKRNEFTSEIYKIELANLPRYVGYGQLKKLLGSKLKLNPHKIKAIGSPCMFAFVTFRCEEDRERALNTLQGYTWKGKQLQVKRANPMADPLVKRRNEGIAEGSPAAKKAKVEGQDIPVSERVKNAVHPLWQLPYEEQLKSKEELISQFLTKLGRRIEKTNCALQGWLQEQRKKNNSKCCELLPTKPSPVVTSYRNKCEFTIGNHLDTGERTVGFRLDRYRSGSMSVAEPDECINIPESMKKAVKSFQDYIRASDKDVFNPETHEGYWRQLTVRTTRNNDIMLIVVMHPQQLNNEQLQVEMELLKNYFENGPGSICGVTSLYFQSFSKKESDNKSPSLKHLGGKKCIEENLLQMKFQISPEAFFQINTLAAEVLYTTIVEMVGDSLGTTILDICCGTGTIGLSLAKYVNKVIGAELSAQAVEDAKMNASINDITNAEFICGKAEEVIQSAIEKAGDENIIAVVDPPRAGVNTKVLKFLRGCDRLKRLIYVSCNPEGAISNFVDLCRQSSNNYRGEPFVPTKAIIVDLFPHTKHCELIMMFERLSEARKISLPDSNGDMK